MDKNKIGTPEQLAFSLVIALFNESERFSKVFTEVRRYLEKNYGSWELILVDDGSRDDTLSLVEGICSQDSRVRMIRLKSNRGQGAAIKVGMLAARGEIVAYSDADLATPLFYLANLEHAIQEEGYDIAIGSRWMGGGEVKKKQPFLRRYLGKNYYKMIYLIFSIDAKDTNCGFKMYRREVAHLLFGFVRSWRWVFNLEHLLLANHFGFRFKEIPVTWAHQDKSKVSIFRDVIFSLWEVFMLRLRFWLGIYPGISKHT